MDSPRRVSIIGAGPAGCAAALAALNQGASVTLYEKSRFPRHKVCGEFLSGEVGEVFDTLGLWSSFSLAHPVRLKHAVLNIGTRRKRFALPEPAYSLSRYALDHLLLREAVARGVDFKRVARTSCDSQDHPIVVAHGRQTATRRGARLFGFKAQFSGHVDEVVEMFFSGGCYVGVSPVENGAVNVCGLAPEELLSQSHFRPEALFNRELRARLNPLEPLFDWLITGPLVFRDGFHEIHEGGRVYLAGDALGFIDPFAGSGILGALITGRLAGEAAARCLAMDQYMAMCRRILGRQYRVASTLRAMLGAGMAESLARFVPGSWLYRLTRPSL